jgi:hypothetical protein
VTDLDVPRDQELERAVLHSIMVKPELLRRLSLPEGVFYAPKHRAVYNAMNNCDADGYPPDLVNVCANMRANGADERSIAYAASILDTGAVSRYAESYAERIKRLAYRRAVLRVEADCIEMAQRPSADAEDIERFRRREMDQAREDYWPPDRAMEPEEGWNRLREFYHLHRLRLARRDHGRLAPAKRRDRARPARRRQVGARPKPRRQLAAAPAELGRAVRLAGNGRHARR